MFAFLSHHSQNILLCCLESPTAKAILAQVEVYKDALAAQVDEKVDIVAAPVTDGKTERCWRRALIRMSATPTERSDW